jgi:ADP-ribose pyrophosphatase YjhB (NUDIX family)
VFLHTIQFCFSCGSPITKREVAGDAKKRYACDQCGNIHYTNPKIVVGALSFWNDKVLLCKRDIEPRRGFWNIPAGYLEDFERAEDGAIRETWEEAGADVEILQPYVIYNLPQANQVYIHFLGRLKDGIVRNGEESMESALFSEEEIPWEQMAFTSSTYALRRFFKEMPSGVFTMHLGTFPDKI